MNKNYLIIFISFLTFGIFAEQSLPLNSIVELDEITYLVNMVKEDNGSIAYRTYPFSAINQAGYYKLANTVTNAISINASNATLDLSGQLVSGTISVASGLNNVQIKNGIIDTTSENALSVQSGCHNIILQNITLKNATRGIFFDSVYESIIKNCDMSQNVTGLELSTCHNVTIENCKALANVNAGFCLLSSTTCSVTDCKAISTGTNNTHITDQTVFGFVASNGNCNIFERCIANSTQALSTTDFSSMIAGFAFRANESCSTISNCESGNAQMAVSGVGQPVGILLEAQPVTVLENPIVGDVSAGIASGLSWTPDGKYLAVGYQLSPFFKLYEFDYKQSALNPIINSLPEIGVAVNRMRWHPSGMYLAIGLSSGTSKLLIYKFDALAQTLTLVAVPKVADEPGGQVFTVDWTPDGNYLAAAILTTSNNLRIYQFNQLTEQINQIVVTTPVASLGTVVDWSPDGNYVGFGTLATDPIFVYKFNRTSGTISPLSTSGFTSAFTLSLEWTADGKYLLAGRESTMEMYQFNINSQTFSLNAFFTLGGSEVHAATITPDGRYIVAGDRPSNTEGLFEFNRNGVITQIAPIVYTPITSNGTRRIAISPDGMYAAITPHVSSPVAIFNILNFPSKNIIKNNIVYCNSGGSIPSGIGISGSSIENLIIQNTAYANPIDPFMVDINYAFVTNVFNPLFQDYPLLNQNIGQTPSVPIEPPANQVYMLNLLNSKLCDIQSKIDLIIAANS